MYFTSYLLALLATFVRSFAAPTKTLEPRAVASQCAQWASIETGTYILYNNLWGESAGTGSQCSQVNSLSGTSISWSTAWSWSGGPYNVKSYTNVVLDITSKPLSKLNTIPTTWAWSYSGGDIIADVSYDSFLGISATSAASYEVMVWLGAIGGAGPLSSTGSPIATPTIGNTTFDLYEGPNGSTKVYSFVAQSKSVTNYSGDLMAFYKYLKTHYGVPSSLYLQSIGAGTEPFTGTNAKLTTSAYSITIS